MMGFQMTLPARHIHTLMLRIFSCGENISNLFLAGALGAEPAPSGGGGGIGPVVRV